jgi:hypothetical protein
MWTLEFGLMDDYKKNAFLVSIIYSFFNVLNMDHKFQFYIFFDIKKCNISETHFFKAHAGKFKVKKSFRMLKGAWTQCPRGTDECVFGLVVGIWRDRKEAMEMTDLLDFASNSRVHFPTE